MHYPTSRIILFAAVCACALFAATSAQAVIISTNYVGNPGNANDSEANSNVPGGTGGVSYGYNIGTYDVTIAQYAEFLNAVAASDPNGLYHTSMGTDDNIKGISRSGSSGSYTYSVIGSAQRPITYVSWYDAARFANWLTNGQGSGGTETGVYTLTGPTTVSAILDHSTITGTKWFIPTESEWYKAAYYNAAGSNYYAYTFQSNTEPTVNVPGSLNNNSGNFYNGVFATTQSGSYSSVNYLTDVGAYPNSLSPYGSYDMGGNVYQWNETLLASSPGLRGGSWGYYSGGLSRSAHNYRDPTFEVNDIGFRVAMLPEPSSLLLLLLGAGGLWCFRKRWK